MTDHAQSLARYSSLMSSHDMAIKGKANKYTALNGNMFSFLGKDGTLFLRLSQPDQAAHDATYGTGPVLQYGSVMRGYVAVPDHILHDDAVMPDLVQRAIDNARALKPKPTKKK